MLKQPAPTQLEEVAAVRNNFSHTTFYFWDGSDGTSLERVGFTLDKIKDPQGNFLKGLYDLTYTIKNEQQQVIHSATRAVDFASSDVNGGNLQGQAHVNLEFTDFLTIGQEGYFDIDFKISKKGSFIANTSYFIFVLKNKSKIKFEAYFLGLQDPTLRRIIVENNTFNNGNYTFYYKMGQSAVQQSAVQVLDKQGIIYQPNLGVYANNLSIMQVYLWYKDQNGETYFSQLLNENKNFCTLRDPKAVLNQQYNLASILYYETSDGIAFSDPIKENRTSQKITSNRVYTQYKVVDYFGYRKYDQRKKNGLQRGLAGGEAGLNGKYTPKKIARLPQELFCFAAEINVLNLNNNILDDSFRTQDLSLFKNLKKVKLVNNTFSANKQQEIKNIVGSGNVEFGSEDPNKTDFINFSTTCTITIDHTVTSGIGPAMQLWGRDANSNNCPFTFIGSYYDGHSKPGVYDVFK